MNQVNEGIRACPFSEAEGNEIGDYVAVRIDMTGRYKMTMVEGWELIGSSVTIWDRAHYLHLVYQFAGEP